jgi:predicted nucleic acid-binding protein
MPAIISNTSPLQYLHQVGHLHLLPELYRRIFIPEAVVEEIRAGRSEGISLPAIEQLQWMEVKRVQAPSLLPLVTQLGMGEKEVLALGLEHSGSLLLLDDRLARRHAMFLSLKMTGTLGILLTAKTRGILSAVRPIVEQLETLGFRLHTATRRDILQLAGEDE